jgi:hypothetical protein
MDDLELVTELLGRAPQGAFEVVVRDDGGRPVVIRNAPLLDDGTPMPTRFWLVGPDEVHAVARLEAAGGVRAAEAAVDPDALAEAHHRYAAERDAALPADWDGPAPAGGVGGTRTGVKCLHAHYAWHLAGGDDPVGRWVASQLAGATRSPTTGLVVQVRDDLIELSMAGVWSERIPLGTVRLGELLAPGDPPAPADLTNAIGAVADHLDDVLIAHPELRDAPPAVHLRGGAVAQVACVEVGVDEPAWPVELVRDAAEDVFRTVATECRADRRHNPGLAPDQVDAVVAASCVVVATMRRLHLTSVTIAP